MNLKNICIAINAFFFLGSSVLILLGYNVATPVANTVALISLPVALVAGLGWRTACTGRGLPLVLFLAGVMIPYAVWLYLKLGHVFCGLPGLLGLSDLCLLPILKKRTAA
jgi:hypothetical protein